MEQGEEAWIGGWADPDPWPGAKVGVEIFHFSGAGQDRGVYRWRAAMIMGPAALKGWAAAVMEARPDASDAFPRRAEQADLAEGRVGANMPRGLRELGESQAMAALFWAIHPLHERAEVEGESALGPSMACRHAMQLPRRRGGGEREPGAGEWFRASFAFFRQTAEPFCADNDPAAKAVAAMFLAMDGMGALPEGGARVEAEPMPPGWAPQTSGIWEMAQLDGFEDLWEQIDLALASAEARPGPKRLPGAAL